MAKRTTEAVLRAEIKVAEAALEKAGGLVSSAQDTVKAAIARLTDAQEAREEAKRRVARSEAALAAYLPIPMALPDVTRDLAREDVDDGIAGELQWGDRIHEPDNAVTVVPAGGALRAGELVEVGAGEEVSPLDQAAPKRKR